MAPDVIALFMGKYGGGFIHYLVSMFSLNNKREKKYFLSPEDGNLLIYATFASVFNVYFYYGFLAVREKGDFYLIPSGEDVVGFVMYQIMLWTVTIIILQIFVYMIRKKLSIYETSSIVLRVIPPSSVLGSMSGLIVIWVINLFFLKSPGSFDLENTKAVQAALDFNKSLLDGAGFFAPKIIQGILIVIFLGRSIKLSGINSKFVNFGSILIVLTLNAAVSISYYVVTRTAM